MVFGGCVEDATFGPSVHGCRGGFDFTLRFEQIVFSLLPSSLFIALCVPRILVLLKRQCIVDGAWFQFTKAGIFVIVASLRLAILILAASAKYSTGLFAAASALDAVAALSMIVLSFFEHSRSPRPSPLLNSYLAAKILLDIAQSRSFWLASQSHNELAFGKLFVAATVLWAPVLVLEAIRKRRWVRWDASEHSPEETIGIYALTTCSWMFKLIRTGGRKILSTQDLYHLDHRMSAEALRSSVENLNIAQFQGKKYALAKALFKTMFISMLMPVVPLLAVVGLGLCEPLLIQRLVLYLDSIGTKSSNSGYGLIGAAILIYFGQPLVASISQYYQTRTLFIVRSILIAAVYQKTTTAQCVTTDDSKALTLMGSDVEKIRFGFLRLHSLWYVPLQIAISCWLLYKQLGAAFAAPIVFIIVLALINAVIVRWVEPLQKAWMERLEERVGKTSNVIANMKNIKISGLAPSVEHSIHGMRIEEMKAATKLRLLEVFIMLTSFAPGSLSAMFTFAVTSHNLNVSTIFTSIALLELLNAPLNSFIQGIPDIISAFVCLQRIQTFLETKNRFDFRQIHDSVEQKLSETPKTPTIQISDGYFGWESERMILKGITASIFPGLNIVVGPVASGKSTLCKVLLGETPFAQGTVNFFLRPETTAFCDQVPSLFNATIKENIVGYADFDEARYIKAIQATMLAPDLAVLPNGDETKVGSNGITLSGGQKQRVSIARAIYEECELYIFDDILSGLDNDTAQHVFKHVFGSSGLLQQRNATVILCTHAVHFLSEAAHIIALGADGMVVEEGTFEHLKSNQKYIQGLGITNNGGEEVATTEARVEPQQNSEIVIKSVKKKSDGAPQDAARASGDFSVFKHYFKSIGKIWGVVFMLVGVLCGFGWSFPNAWLGLWSNDVSKPPQTHPNSFYVGIFSLLSCLRLAFTIVEIAIGCLVIAKISGLNLHKDAIRTVIAAPLRFFVKTDVGIVTNLFSQDLSLIDNELPTALIDTVAMFWMVLGSSAVAVTSSVYLLISYPFLIAAAYLIQRFYLKTSRQLRLLDLEAKSPLYTHFIDTMTSLATFRAFRWTAASILKNNSLLDGSTAPAYQLSMIQRWLVTTLRFLTAVIAVAVVALSTQLKASAGFAGASMISLITFSAFLSSLVGNYTILETSLGGISRLRAFGRDTEREDLPGEDAVPSYSWPEKGHIQITGISASYDYSPSLTNTTSENPDTESDEPETIYALRDLDMVIESGQKVAICGRTGSGKSSFILMLLRLLDPFPHAGLKLEIDGLSLTEVNRGALRDRIIAVPQEPVFLPNGTSFSLNLDPDQVATDEECRGALQTVELWEFVSGRGGLQTSLSPDIFSLGQKQLFSLARAILRRRVKVRQHLKAADTSMSIVSASITALKDESATTTTPLDAHEDGGVLVLDEYGSSLDIATDRLMQKIIMKEFQKYTIVMVSHRLEMVMDFDKVVILDTGRVVEEGSPRELVQKEGSRFKDLWAARHSA